MQTGNLSRAVEAASVVISPISLVVGNIFLDHGSLPEETERLEEEPDWRRGYFVSFWSKGYAPTGKLHEPGRALLSIGLFQIDDIYRIAKYRFHHRNQVLVVRQKNYLSRF